MTFKELDLSPKILAAIEQAGYTSPTPIQEAAIPPGIEGKDILGIAQTGTGKTASFVIPMLSRLERGRARARMPRSLILAPTRELAAQVAAAFEELGVNHKYTVALLIGGVSFAEQNKKLDRGADILIATPGRLLDHFSRGRILLTGVEILVIDEADRMLDMGFIDDIKKICGLLPPRRQTMFFSATMPEEIIRFTTTFLKDPVKVEIERQSTTADTITQRFQFCSGDPQEKRETFRKAVEKLDVVNAIVFCNRKRDVAIMQKSMEKHGYNTGCLHGDLDQRQRMATLDKFRGGELTYLIASDVAARGLDIPNVGHVFNFDVPTHAEDYVHRIGRTGRAGREGYAATFVTPPEKKYLDAITRLCKVDPTWIGDAPDNEDFSTKRGGRPSNRRGRPEGGRPEGGRPEGRKDSRKDGRSRSDSNDKAALKPEPNADKLASSEDTKQQSERSSRNTKPENNRNTAKNERSVRTDDRAAGSEREDRGSRRHNQPKPTGQQGRGDKQASSQSKQNTQSRVKSNKAQPPVLGMGDHTPAFLTRSVKRPTKVVDETE